MDVPILCGKCSLVFDETFVFFQHHPEHKLYLHVFKNKVLKIEFGPFAQWKLSALASNCHLCSMFLKTLRGEKTKKQLEVDPADPIFAISRINGVIVKERYVEGGAPLIFWYLENDRTNDFLTSNAVVLAVRPSKKVNPHLSTTYGTTWPSPNLGQLKSWLEECKGSHSGCRQIEETRLPLRLVDVYPMGTVSAPPHDIGESSRLSLERMPSVVLRPSSELPATTEYLTLSHRWDPNPVVYLSHDTQFFDAIPAELLCHPKSKTFKDAIEVTRHLGFRYIWIDSICINQEDEIEKAHEISFMDQIYKRSSLNISATGATTAADGLFCDRAPLTINRRYRAIDGSKRTFDVVACQKDRWLLYVEPATINTRGWVFQERMLSPRVAHFAEDQLYWECADMDASEEYTKGIPNTLVGTRFFNKSNLSKVTPSQRAKLWFTIIGLYSSFSLTFQNDRLPAMSAIARHFCAKTGMHAKDYIAGCWRIDLPYCLDWTSQRQTRSNEYIAPSWSWASTGAGVEQLHQPPWRANITALANLIDVSVTHKYEDQFGEISSGFMQLKCSLCQFNWREQAARLEIRTQYGDSPLVYSRHSSRKDELSLYWDYHMPGNKGALDQESMMLSSLGTHIFSDDIFCLMPLGADHEYGLDHYTTVIFGLILHRTGERGQYVRVGRFDYNHNAWEKDVEAQRLRDAILGSPQDLELDSSLQIFPDGKNLIEII